MTRAQMLRRVDWLADTVERHKAGEPVGVYSVCSAHPTVLEAAIRRPPRTTATCSSRRRRNQVDQFGGYTGHASGATSATWCSASPTRTASRGTGWCSAATTSGRTAGSARPPSVAMEHAETLIAAYVEAGYAKIHLDCSMSLRRRSGRRSPTRWSPSEQRAAAAGGRGDGAGGRAADAPVYVIGTEVPVPGGAHETLDASHTDTGRARPGARWQRTATAFAAVGADDVWPRVMALVVQPGVEFDHLHVIDYEHAAHRRAARTSSTTEPHLVFEAHSTDYQRPAQLRELVEDHWAVLKVGPGLTFAMREALFALAMIETELVPRPSRSNLIEVVERRMLAEPKYWRDYYEGDPIAQRTARRYSYSDRLRYYWADDEVDAARKMLLANLDRVGIPLPLISQFLPLQYERLRAGHLDQSAGALVDRPRPRRAAALRGRVPRRQPRRYPMTHTAIPDQKDGGATILEIGQQPDAWREVAGRRGEQADAFLRDLLARPDLRIILTGAGSSAFAGEIAAPVLRRHLRRRVEPIATTDIVASPRDHLEAETPTLLVSFARQRQQPREPRDHRAGRPAGRPRLAPGAHLRPGRQAGPRAPGPARLAGGATCPSAPTIRVSR